MKRLKAAGIISLGILMMFLWACGGGDSSSTTESDDSNGTLSLMMVDAPGGPYKAVYVTIKEVQVCIEKGPCDESEASGDCECKWETIATLEQTHNLLELVNGVMAGLGQKDLEAGTYHQMRLLLSDQPEDTLNLLDQPHPHPQYLIDENDQIHAMKVPSGYETGIKLVHPFEIVAGLTTELILDFDVSRSVIEAGASGKYLLKPTIKVIGTHNRATVSGIVAGDDETPLPLEGARVDALYQDGEGNWQTAMSTMTDGSGGYMLYLDLGGDDALAPKEYKLVATADGYEPSCITLTVLADETYTADFTLTPTQMVEVTGTITGHLASENGAYPEAAPVVTISFSRQVGECDTSPVESAFINATDDADPETADIFYDNSDGSFQYQYSIALPAGIYDATAGGEGLTPVVVNAIEIAAGPLTLDFDF